MWSSLDWSRINALFKHWEREPPVEVSAHYLARFFGAKAPDAPKAEPKAQTKAEKEKAFADAVDELRMMFPGGVIR